MEYEPFVVGAENSSPVKSGPIVYCRYAFFMRAVGATVNVASRFDAVAYDPASAVLALGGKGVNRAFEAIKIAGDAVMDNLQGLVVFVSADFTLHNKIL